MPGWMKRKVLGDVRRWGGVSLGGLYEEGLAVEAERGFSGGDRGDGDGDGHGGYGEKGVEGGEG